MTRRSTDGRTLACAKHRAPIFSAALIMLAGITLAACGAPNAPGVASLGSGGAKGSPTTVPAKGNPNELLVRWAACMRRHGDPDQPDPTIDSHGGIIIDMPGVNGGSLPNEVHDGTAPCNQFLAAAAAALRAGVPNLTPPNQSALVRYAECMRVNGEPNYPDPGAGGRTNLNGIDMNSPFFKRANRLCGRQIGAPSWWISGAGPPGDISVQSGPSNSFGPHTGPNRPRTTPTAMGTG